MRLEKLAFKKIELWWVGVVLIVGSIASIAFAAAVRHHNIGGERLGRWGSALDAVASFPGVAGHTVAALFNLLDNSDFQAVEQRFPGESGFYFADPPGQRTDLGYVLVNRYDGDRGYSVAELWDLREQQRLHVWRFDAVDTLWSGSTLHSRLVNVSVDAHPRRFRAAHGVLNDKGEIYVKWNTPVIKADVCSVLSLVNDDAIYHHSMVRDASGDFWLPKFMDPKTVNIGSPRFLDDAITKLDSAGNVLFEKSVIQLLDENGLGYLVYGAGKGNNDPIHLNDIEPVPGDGPYWKAGDVFLSVRNLSMVLLYRPATNRVIWHRQGPWMHQHDVNIVSDHEISVFNNNAALSKGDESTVRGVNDLVIYDFDKDATRSPWKTGFERLNIRTNSEGLAYAFGQEAFVEESNFGRLMQFDSDGRLAWRFVNRAANGKVYVLNWSRPVSRQLGDKIKTLVKGRRCQ